MIALLVVATLLSAQAPDTDANEEELAVPSAPPAATDRTLATTEKAPSRRLHPAGWTLLGAAAGTCMGLGASLPCGLLACGIGASYGSVFVTRNPGPLDPLMLFTPLMLPLAGFLTGTALGLLLYGWLPAGLTTGVITVVGSARNAGRRLPWIPTLAVAMSPRIVGGLLAGALAAVPLLAFAGYVVGPLYYSLFSNVPSALPRSWLWGLYIAGLLLCAIGPIAAVLAGSLMGDLLAAALMVPVDRFLGADAHPANENPT